MELAVMIEGQEGVTWPQWRAIAEACEEHGVPSLFRSDHYLPLDGDLSREVLDAWATICALAAVTTRLRLGTLVSPATFRHPSQLAKVAVTADHVSGGRIELGLGAGWNEPEHTAFGFPFAATGARMSELAEQLEIVRGLWGDGPFSFEGEHYRLERVDALPKPVQRPSIPLIMGGAAKPRGAALAARFADEYNVHEKTPDECRAARARLDPSLRFSLMTGASIGRARADVEGRTERLRARGHGRRIGPAWIVGTVDEAVDHLRVLADSGVERVMFQLLLHEELDQIELIGRELAPAVA
jgi:alkanesulfonate monooxygenase SsuD/methylene tetrahydromethanopterin reductase-like flavin-dependent oxidoreductase (luciferase family)